MPNVILTETIMPNTQSAVKSLHSLFNRGLISQKSLVANPEPEFKKYIQVLADTMIDNGVYKACINGVQVELDFYKFADDLSNFLIKSWKLSSDNRLLEFLGSVHGNDFTIEITCEETAQIFVKTDKRLKLPFKINDWEMFLPNNRWYNTFNVAKGFKVLLEGEKLWTGAIPLEVKIYDKFGGVSEIVR